MNKFKMNKPKMIYLAGPMKGLKDFNFPAFHKASDYLRSNGFEVGSPAEYNERWFGKEVFKGCGDEAILLQKQPRWNRCTVLSQNIRFVCEEADIVAMLFGWETSTGATAEHAVGEALGLHIIYQYSDETWPKELLERHK